MTLLRIDDVVCKLRNERVELPRYSAKRCESVQAWRENLNMEVEVVATPTVTALLGYANDMYRVEEFNATKHKGEIIVDGTPIFEGEATVLGVEREGEALYYRIDLRVPGHDWAHNAAKTRLCDSGVELSMPMTLPAIEDTWRGSRAVRMLPLRRDSYPEPEETGLYVAQRVMMPHDYYPFISVEGLVKKMVSDSGYELKSEFFDTSHMKRLVMSGAYKSVDTSLLESTMGFKAMRSRSVTAAAGEDGRTYVWEPIMASNIGAIVDTVDPNVVGDNGVVMQGAYANGGCFVFDNGRPVFTPKREISVAFDMHLHYTTEYKITSSRYLTGFTHLHLGSGCDVEVALHNPFIDMRNNVRGGQQYKLYIFDFNPRSMYMLSGYGLITSRVTTLSFDKDFSGATTLLTKPVGSNDFVTYDGDWALYDGYVPDSGNREVVLDVRTPFESLSPSNPKRFNDIFFGGAYEGQSMTLHAGCSVTPVFGGMVGYGEQITFSDVANIDISQAELLEAIAHMYNLRFYSHEPTKSLYVEPYDDFFGGEEIDWQDRQVGEHEVVTERASESYQRTVIGYQSADGAAARYVEGEERDLGTWDYHVENYATKRSTESILNPLFHPVASFAGASPSAPSAMVLTVGDRNVLADGDNVEPRVALYYGMSELPKGEYWMSPNGRDGYPLVTFHSEERGATLCFDDRDGCRGLHRYYDTELRERAMRQRLECDIRLLPMEYASLFTPNEGGATVRSNFRLKACGQSSLFRLESIESYDVETKIARCVFVRRLTD